MKDFNLTLLSLSGGRKTRFKTLLYPIVFALQCTITALSQAYVYSGASLLIQFAAITNIIFRSNFQSFIFDNSVSPARSGLWKLTLSPFYTVIIFISSPS